MMNDDDTEEEWKRALSLVAPATESISLNEQRAAEARENCTDAIGLSMCARPVCACDLLRFGQTRGYER
jgi:hypothetical protein